MIIIMIIIIIIIIITYKNIIALIYHIQGSGNY